MGRVRPSGCPADIKNFLTMPVFLGKNFGQARKFFATLYLIMFPNPDSKIFLFILLFFALAAYGQMQERVAIIQTLDNNDSIGFQDLAYLTDKLRETAVKVLPKKQYGVMTTESIIAFLGSQEEAVKACNESSCLAVLGRRVNADYVAQGRIGRFNNNLTIKVELYDSRKGNLIDSFTGESKDIAGLRDIIDMKAADLFREIIDESKTSKPEPSPEVEKLVVEKPEQSEMKLEISEFAKKLEPWKPEPEKPMVKEPVKTSFWVALGLDALGVAVISIGLVENQKVLKAGDEYNVAKQSPEYYKDARKEVENARNTRNTLYIVGGVLLASGVGVHIWF